MALKDKDAHKRYCAEYYKKHREYILNRVKKYAEENPDKVAASQAETRKRHRKRRNEKQMSAYRQKRSAEVGDMDARVRSLVSHARYRSKSSGHKFDEGLYELLSDNASDRCPVCGKEFNLKGRDEKRGIKDSPTLDRVDNDRGYELDNVAVICYDCNSKKSHSSVMDMVSILEYMLKHSDGEFGITEQAAAPQPPQ